MSDLYTLPPDLPVPKDDGAAGHLAGIALPNLVLDSSQGQVNVHDFAAVSNDLRWMGAARP